MAEEESGFYRSAIGMEEVIAEVEKLKKQAEAGEGLTRSLREGTHHVDDQTADVLDEMFSFVGELESHFVDFYRSDFVYGGVRYILMSNNPDEVKKLVGVVQKNHNLIEEAGLDMYLHYVFPEA